MSNRITLAQACEMATAALAKLEPELLALLLEDVAALKASAKKADDAIYAALHHRYGDEAATKRREKNVDTGTIRIDDAGFVISADLPKRVEWDQEGLAKVEKTLAEMGEPIAEYIKLKRDVSELAYRGWPSSLKKLFDPYRTLGVGKPTYKMAPKGE